MDSRTPAAEARALARRMSWKSREAWRSLSMRVWVRGEKSQVYST
jgi:hypothetical protein